MTEEENPVLKAMEAYRRAHPRQADAVDEAMERGVPEDSEVESLAVPADDSGRESAPASEQLPLLPDPDRNTIGQFHGPDSGAPETEREAAILQAVKSGTDRRKVLDALAAAEDLTDDEIAAITGLRRYTAAPRRNELVRMGWAKMSENRRPTDSGSPAKAWKLTDKGRAQWYPTSP